jgi:lysophospholipase L1-like esterase
VFYAGDNDIAMGRAPERVLADFQAIARHIRRPLPQTPIVFIAIKPSLARWSQFERQSRANEMVRAFCRAEPGLAYLDIVGPMLRDGKPRPELFGPDGLHLSEDGYRLWSRLLRPLLSPPPPFDPRHFD